MKLELGKKYTTRSGLCVGPMTTSNDDRYPFQDSDSTSLTWMPDGRFDVQVPNHPTDIVSEYVEPTAPEDLVNHPPHYKTGGLECIDAIKAQLTPEEYRGYLKGNVIKYVWRERQKGGNESLRKAEWYLKRLADES